MNFKTLLPLALVLSTGCASANFQPKTRGPQGGLLQAGGASPTNGIQIGFDAVSRNIDGEFDGDLVLLGSSDSIFVPDTDTGSGLKFRIGSRQGTNAWEFALTQTDYDGRVGAATVDVEESAFAINWKKYFTPHGPVQPYFLLGFGFNKATLVNGSVDTSLNVGDAELTGIDIPLGLGMEYYLNPAVALNFRLAHHFVNYGSAEGIVGSGIVDEGVDGGGLEISFGITATL